MRDGDDDEDLPTMEGLENFVREVILVPPVVKLDDDEEVEKPESR
ncbi:MAG: hypothetical protein V6Z81_08820 [Parvularculales bacterium]